MSQPIRILIVDDHPVVRRGLSALLEADAGMQVVGEAGDGQAALETAARLEPDVVLMDYRMPGSNGADVTRAVRAENRKIVVIAISNDDRRHIRHAMLEAGAYGFFLKGADVSSLLAMIRQAVRPE